ncbi:MAG: hypothetical protein ABS75_20325 [Pelagibacterium sp. SCN 63-23]|nr:MAG: hypothetical protein ABS75_20325 [Pelagibacterium sp. SCN 63-23]
MRHFLAILAALVAAPAFASEELAQQIDIVAPLVNSGDFEALGGPDTPESLVQGVDGRWFTLDNMVRNWEGSGAPDRERLARNIERTCADDWENIVIYETTGPDSFRVSQTSPSGEDNGTFDMQPVADTDRTFTAHMEDEYILAIFGLEDAGALQQEAALNDMRDRLSEGLQIWRPTPDLIVNVSSAETEVWGRCPD